MEIGGSEFVMVSRLHVMPQVPADELAALHLDRVHTGAHCPNVSQFRPDQPGQVLGVGRRLVSASNWPVNTALTQLVRPPRGPL